MDDALFNVLSAVVIFVIGLITRYVLPWLKEQVVSNKVGQVMIWAYKFVQAAEQTMTGADKKTYVTEQLKKLLMAKKLSLSEDQIDAIVESTVNELFPKEAKKNAVQKDNDGGSITG